MIDDLDKLKSKIEAKWAIAEDVKVHKIEAKHYGVWVRLKCSVAGMSDPKNVPLRLTAEASGEKKESSERKGEVNDVLLATLMDPDMSSVLRTYLFDRGSLRKNIAKAFGGNLGEGRRLELSEERIDYTVLLVRPLLSGEKFEEATYRTRKIHLVGKPPPKEKEVEILAIVTDDERGNLLPLAYDYSPLNSRSVNCTVEDHKVFAELFKPETIEGSIDGTIAPHIVGRQLAKMAVSLVLHSPLRIRFQNRSTIGLIKVMLLGTSTTGKSEIGSSPTEMKIHETVTGDLSKSTGLMAAVDAEEKTVVWGVIPLADREAIFIDSFQKIEPQDLARMREAFRIGFVDVVKFVRARAPCRTRIIAAANARKDLDDYTNPCEGLTDCWPFQDTADIARWEIFIPFLQSDVSFDEIARAEAKPPRIPAEVFRKHVLWAWGLTEDDVVFTPEAERAIVEGFLELSQYQLPSLPLVNNDTKRTLAKIAASYAILTHSPRLNQTSPVQQIQGEGGSSTTGVGGSEEGGALKSAELINSDEVGKVEVTEGHSNWAIEFYKRILDAWDFRTYCDWVMERRRLREDEIREIEALFEEDDTAERIFLLMAKRQGLEAGTLAEKLNISKTWIIKEVSKLKGLDLVDSAERRKGYWLTVKGTSYAKLLLKKAEDGVPPESPPEVPLGTREKMDVILRIVEDLEAVSGSANMEELEKRAMESGIGMEEFKTLLVVTLREGILYSVDEVSVKRRR